MHLELPLGLEALIYDMHQTTLVSINGKLAVLQLRSPLFNSHELFFIGGKSFSSGTQ